MGRTKTILDKVKNQKELDQIIQKYFDDCLNYHVSTPNKNYKEEMKVREEAIKLEEQERDLKIRIATKEWKTEEDIEKIKIKYSKRINKMQQEKPQKTIQRHRPQKITITWLAHALEMDRNTIRRWRDQESDKSKEDDRKSRSIKKAYSFVERCYEEYAMNKNSATWAIFTLVNNCGRKNLKEVQHSWKDWWPIETKDLTHEEAIHKFREIMWNS